MSEAKSPIPVNPAEAFESLILLSYRWTAMVGGSALMAERQMTVPAFVILATAAAEPGTAIGKLARKAGLEKTDVNSALKALRASGLVVETPNASGKGRTLAPTDKGRETLAALRADFGEVASQLPETNWRAVPRMASILRRSARVLPKAGSEATED